MKDFKEEINLNLALYFNTPIYHVLIPDFLKDLNSISNQYIIKAKKQFKKKETFGLIYHSENMVNDKKIFNFQKFLIKQSYYILDSQGYDLKNFNFKINDIWVQEFSEKGGGHHNSHIHSNNHISGFYFLKCSDKTSYPIFHDPRSGKTMLDLPQKNEKDITLASFEISYKIVPGTLLFFNSYLTHQFCIDQGKEPFRFIHFNIQAIPNNESIY